MSGMWVRCPNCDLAVKVELTFEIVDGDAIIEPDFSGLEGHARNCAAR